MIYDCNARFRIYADKELTEDEFEYTVGEIIAKIEAVASFRGLEVDEIDS